MAHVLLSVSLFNKLLKEFRTLLNQTGQKLSIWNMHFMTCSTDDLLLKTSTPKRHNICRKFNNLLVVLVNIK